MSNGWEKGLTQEHLDEIKHFNEMQKWPYSKKVQHAQEVAERFVDDCIDRNVNYHISVGGLDSITLLCFLRDIGIDLPAISVSSLEDLSIQRIHKQLGVEALPPSMREDGTRWTKAKIIQEFGFPVISKEKAAKIELLQNPTEKNKTVRHAIITGETGEYGGNRKNSKMKLPQKWLELFGGYENENEGVNYCKPNFKVSSRCCYYLKEKPCDDWAREHNSVPFLGLMASEGGRREKSLKLNGCTYWGKTSARCAPFAIFNRNDLLTLALELEAPVPEVYGTIERNVVEWIDDKCVGGDFYTTGAQRTGCSMCGFGIHIEERPHRFDRLRERNEKEWHFWMYECCTDDDTGEKYGWGRVLDYIGVQWEDEYVDFEKMQIKWF